MVYGRSEFGPRALGGRCILADPRRKGMASHLNGRVKHREWFRPYAPVVLAEKSADYFYFEGESPYMLLVVKLREDKKAVIPSAAHVDGTARIQTVTEAQNPFLYGLLREFERITSVPVLILTSFNDHGDPIVESPSDAFACFAATDQPYLAMGDILLCKKPTPEPCRE
jgi:carbamoyltransferase